MLENAQPGDIVPIDRSQQEKTSAETVPNTTASLPDSATVFDDSQVITLDSDEEDMIEAANVVEKLQSTKVALPTTGKPEAFKARARVSIM